MFLTVRTIDDISTVQVLQNKALRACLRIRNYMDVPVHFFFFFYCCHTSQLTSRSSSTGFSKHYYKISGGRGILVEQEGCYTYR